MAVFAFYSFEIKHLARATHKMTHRVERAHDMDIGNNRHR